MPVQVISGLAGTVGSNPDPGGLQAFADHLQRAKEGQRQDAIQQLNFMMNLTKESGGQFVPEDKVVQKLLKQAGMPDMMLSASRPGPRAPAAATDAPPMGAFEAMAAAARQREAAATELGQAQIASTRASTAASEQQTALSKQTMQFAAANQQHLQTIQAAEARIGAMAYPDTPDGRNQQLADARIIALEKNLSPELKRHLEMTPAEEKEFNDQLAADARMTHSKAQLEMAGALGDLRVQDEKTGTMRELTSDEINGILSGKAVPVGLVSKQKQQELALKTMEAQATAKRADADMIQAQAYGKLTDQQAKKYEAETELDLAKAKALHDKGIVTNYEDLMKAFDAVEKMKRSSQPLDKTLVKHLEDELARFYGGTPVETKGMIDRWMNRGYTFGGAPVVSEDALKGVTTPGAPPPGYELGRAVPGLATGAITGVGKATEEGGQFLEQFIRGIVGVPGQSVYGPDYPRGFVGPIPPGKTGQR